MTKATVFVGFAVALSAATALADSKKMEDTPEPEKTAGLQTWSPSQQWMLGHYRFGDQGYNGAAGRLLFADEMGDKLSELGRVNVIEQCVKTADKSPLFMWALCGADVKAVDMKKLDAELTAAGITDKGDVLKEATEIVDKAKKMGAQVDEDAKTDPGVAATLKVVDQAKAEWNAYIAKNKEAYDRFIALQDGVRTQKSNHKNFTGCWEKTQPAFAKLVKATKLPYKLDENDQLPGYMAFLLTNVDAYVTTGAFAFCAYSVHESGEALVAGLYDQPAATMKAGWRTIALGKLLDENFKPKFADRSIHLSDMTFAWTNYKSHPANVNGILDIMTPTTGEIATVKIDGDVAKLHFKGDKVEACLQWKDTNKVHSVSAGGDVNYERTCVKRGMVDNQESDTEISAKFAGGLAPGISVLLVDKIPVDAWKKPKTVAVFGIPVK